MSAQPCVIGGKLVVGTDTLDVLDPASGELLDRTVRGTADHIDAAVAAARAASKQWRRVSAADRSRTLRRIADLIRHNSDELAALESRDTGKPLSQARADAAVAARYFEYYAHTIEAFFGISLPANGGLLAYTKHEPFGVTGHIIPWNYPLQIACRTVAPAIAVGNCAVVKPAEEAPLSVIKLAQLALEAGLPPGLGPRPDRHCRGTRASTTCRSRVRSRSDPSLRRQRPKMSFRLRSSWAASRRMWSSQTPTWMRPSPQLCGR
jgi:aldehyde dehydrogenase (NAD+)